jgi:hypothetical protein
MELKPGELCISSAHPAFLGAMTVGIAAALVLSVALGRLERRLRGVPLSQLYRNLIWFGVLSALFFGTVALLNVLFLSMHPDLTLCTSLIWRWLFVPPILSFVGAVTYGIRDRKRASEREARTPVAQ